MAPRSYPPITGPGATADPMDTSDPTEATDGSDPAVTLPARAVDAAERSLRGRLTERYDHLGMFARGGMSTVHRTRDVKLQRIVAMKVLDPVLAEGEVHRQRFDAEAQITGQLDHPNIVPIYDLGETLEGERFITMKLIAGKNLRAALAEAGPVPAASGRLDEFLGVFLKVCDAVSFAHSRGVIHRDLKPENVVLGDYGEVYVMDWGIARLKSQDADAGSVRVSIPPHPEDPDARGTPVGTPYYMAPEQAMGIVADIDERTDVFALGAMLYEILTGKPPYEGNTILAVLYQAMSGTILSPEVRTHGAPIPPGLCRITMRAMAREPAQRYPSAVALKREVEHFLRGVARFPTQVFPPGTMVVAEGAEGDAAYVITRGRCQAFKHIAGEKVVLRVMGPGEVFGETAVFSARPRTASVEALDELTVMVVTRESLAEGLGLHTWMGAFVKALADRFTELDQKFTAMDHQARTSLAPPEVAEVAGVVAGVPRPSSPDGHGQ